MHELSIAHSIIDIVHQYVPQDDGHAVREVKVRIGSLAGVVPESLEFCFSALTTQTPLGSARLNLEIVPTMARCNDCGVSFEVRASVFLCPSCGSGRTVIESGRELHVVEIDIDDGVESA